MDTNKQKNLIAQSRQLVEAKYNFNLWELRLFVEVLQQIRKNDKDLKKYRLYYKDIIAQYGKHKKDYEYIRNASISLLRKVAHFDYTTENGRERTYHAVLFTGADTPKNWQEEDENMYIDFKVNSDLKEQLIQLKKNYLLYDKRNILRLKSKFSVRIYQILKSYERKNRDSIVVELSVTELRAKLLVNDKGESTQQYKKYFLFKKYVLFQAQKELEEHTDIAFSFDEVKKGRCVDSIKFYVRKNRKNKIIEVKKQKSKPPVQELQLFETEQSEALQALIKAGIETDKALPLITMLGDGVALAELKNAQKALKNAYDVKSETGFIITMMEKQSYTKSQAIKKAEQDKKKKKAKAHKAEVEKHKKQITELRKEYTRERNKAVNIFLKDFSKDKVAELVDERVKEKPLIISAIKRAEEQGNKDEVHNFKYGLFVKDLEDESLHNFEKYIKRAYNFKLTYKGNDQFLVKVN